MIHVEQQLASQGLGIVVVGEFGKGQEVTPVILEVVAVGL